ncbi:MAG: glutamate--tRNA ligase [Desulfobacteraceae bacterium]|nr:glutamate--tRNA ligase [Desulfobacteraceae bacterium]
MEKVRTRFAPSPTGYLHVGGARTALFNWLWARHTGGVFILRIEDTDVARSTQESTDAIFEAMEWLGIDWDEGPFYQSRRGNLYREAMDRLLAAGKAYACDCSAEALEKMRERGMALDGRPRYDGTCREKGLEWTEGTVLRFKVPRIGVTVLPDQVKGDIAFQNADLDDFIIARSDRSPTYNFTVVVDDIDMGVNTIIRGDDHVMNTPKQMLLYQALESPLPAFGHVPMVLGPDRTRLSKRHGATSVTAFRDMGYLPEAMINYLARLGWSHGDQEFFTRDELIEKFTVERIGKSAGIFDMEKLTSLNADHIMATPVEDLGARVEPFLTGLGFDASDTDYRLRVVETLVPRSKTLVDMAAQAAFYYEEDVVFEEQAAKKFLRPVALEPARLLLSKLEALQDWKERALEGVFQAVMDETGLKLGKIAQPVRVALTGRSASPGIFEIIDILGREKTVLRLKKALAFIEARAAKAD